MDVSFLFLKLCRGRVQGEDDFPKVVLVPLNGWVAGQGWKPTYKAGID